MNQLDHKGESSSCAASDEGDSMLYLRLLALAQPTDGHSDQKHQVASRQGLKIPLLRPQGGKQLFHCSVTERPQQRYPAWHP